MDRNKNDTVGNLTSRIAGEMKRQLSTSFKDNRYDMAGKEKAAIYTIVEDVNKDKTLNVHAKIIYARKIIAIVLKKVTNAQFIAIAIMINVKISILKTIKW